MASTEPDTTEPSSGAYPVVRLLPGRHKRVRAGHPWIFSNEIDMTAEAKALTPGGLVTLLDLFGRRPGWARIAADHL